MRAVGANELLAAAEKSEFGLIGVVGGMMVIEMLAGNMRRRRGGIAAVEDDMRQTYTEGSDPIVLTPLCCDPIVLGIAAVEVLRLDMV